MPDVLVVDVTPQELDSLLAMSPLPDCEDSAGHTAMDLQPRACCVLDTQHMRLATVAHQSFQVGCSSLYQIESQLRADDLVRDFNRIVLAVGGLDVTRAIHSGTSFQDTMNMFKLVHAAVHDIAPDAYIIWVAIPPVPSGSPRFNAAIKAVNFGLARLCYDSYQGVLLDTSKVFRDKKGLFEYRSFTSATEDGLAQLSHEALYQLRTIIEQGLTLNNILGKRTSKFARKVLPSTKIFAPGCFDRLV